MESGEIRQESAPPWMERGMWEGKTLARSGGWGYVTSKGQERALSGLEVLCEVVRDLSQDVVGVWTPETGGVVFADEVEELEGAWQQRLEKLEKLTWREVSMGGWVFGGFFLWAWVAAWSRGGWSGVGASQSVGLSVLLALVFVLFPWLQFLEIRRFQRRGEVERRAQREEELFEFWVRRQKGPLTGVLVGLVGLVGLVQVWKGGGISEAGILKERVREGAWWLALTGGLLHGSVLHFSLNISGLWYLGKRLEIVARWPHLVMVFFLSLAASGWATTRFLPASDSVGVSGAVAGLLGFLLVFETLHPRLVPGRARLRLGVALGVVILMGVVGYQWVDNAAHLGGLVMGAGYALMVFPPSGETRRPVILKRDEVGGWLALVSCALIAGLAVGLMLWQGGV